MTALIRVDQLGGVEVSGADPAQVRSSARAVSLLAHLVSHPESAHLAGVLWPDLESAQARTNLRRELHHLRFLLHDHDCLRVDAQSLCWRRRLDCVVDVHDFITACERTITALESGQRDGVELHSGVALTLYRRPFLPGCGDDWALAVRDDLNRTCVDLCDRVARYCLTHDNAAAAITFARRRILLEPPEEPGCRLLMQALCALGDRAGAMRTYHQCATVLERDLGVGPSPEIHAELDAALSDLRRGSGDAGSGGSADTARWSLSPPGLVGRANERGRISLGAPRTAAGPFALAGIRSERFRNGASHNVRVEQGGSQPVETEEPFMTNTIALDSTTTRAAKSPYGERAALTRGPLILPDSDDYDEARAVSNAMIDRHPAAVLRCRDVADVMAGVGFARDHASSWRSAVVDTTPLVAASATTHWSST